MYLIGFVIEGMVLIVAITGASGAIYGVTLLKVLSELKEVETHLIISRDGETTIKYETEWSIEQVKSLADYCYDFYDVGAQLASGSFRRDGTVIAPCTVKTMSALANSYTDNLISRAGDVTLKERKPLIAVLRETPLHLGHIKNMLRLTEMGAIIFPPVPSFYSKPRTVDNIVNETVGHILDLLNIQNDMVQRWGGTGNIRQDV